MHRWYLPQKASSSPVPGASVPLLRNVRTAPRSPRRGSHKLRGNQWTAVHRLRRPVPPGCLPGAPGPAHARIRHVLLPGVPLSCAFQQRWHPVLQSHRAFYPPGVSSPRPVGGVPPAFPLSVSQRLSFSLFPGLPRHPPPDLLPGRRPGLFPQFPTLPARRPLPAYPRPLPGLSPQSLALSPLPVPVDPPDPCLPCSNPSAGPLTVPLPSARQCRG